MLIIIIITVIVILVSIGSYIVIKNNSASKNITDNTKKNPEKLALVDPANVCMIIAKTETAKHILTGFIDSDGRTQTEPNLDYAHDGNFTTQSKFSGEYLKVIFGILSASGDSINISTKKEYPGSFETKDFKLILAPRIDEA